MNERVRALNPVTGPQDPIPGLSVERKAAVDCLGQFARNTKRLAGMAAEDPKEVMRWNHGRGRPGALKSSDECGAGAGYAG